MNLNHVLQEEQSNYFTGVTNECYVRKHLQTLCCLVQVKCCASALERQTNMDKLIQLTELILTSTFQKYLLSFEYILWKSAGIACCYMRGTILSGLTPDSCKHSNVSREAFITIISLRREEHGTPVRKGENRVQYVTSGSVLAQPTPPHLPQTTYQSGYQSVPRSPCYRIKTYPWKLCMCLCVCMSDI